MRLKVSSKRVRVSLSMRRMACSSVSSALGEVRELAVEVFLALGLLLQLVDGGEVHLAELLDVRLHALQRVFPDGHAGVGGQALLDLRQLEARGGELLRDGLATHARFLRGELALLPSRRARSARAARRRGASRRARAARPPHLPARGGPSTARLPLRAGAPARRPAGACSSTMGASPLASSFSSSAQRCVELRALLHHAVSADADGAFRRAARLDADQQIARSNLRGLGIARGARPRSRGALRARSPDPAGASRARPSVEQAAIELAARARERFLRDADFARDFRRLLFEALPAQGGFLRAGAHGFELAEQVRVLAMRALDAGLRAIALALPHPRATGARSPRCASMPPHALFGSGEIRAQRLQPMLALDDAGVMIRAAADAQPVPAEPFAACA